MASDQAVQAEFDSLRMRLEISESRLRDVATMGAIVTSIQEIDAVLSVVMDMSARLVDGEVGLIMLEEKGELQTRIAWGLKPEIARSICHEGRPDLPGQVFESSTPVCLGDLGMSDDAGRTIDSVICVPIRTSDSTLGVQMLVNKASGGGFTKSDQEVLVMLTNFAAVAIENNRLVQDRLRQQEHMRELAIARQVQKTIMPVDVNCIQGVEIGAAYYPMGEVGGDFYDVVRLNDDEFMVSLGDVSSHGVPAALVMSAAAGITKAILNEDPSISVSALVRRLNNLISKEIIKDKEMFLTLFVARVNLKTRTLAYCNAGHLPGLYWHQATGKLEQLSKGGPIVGQFPGIPYSDHEVAIADGDSLFLYSDGLTEAADATGELFGKDRVEGTLRDNISMRPSEFCASVKAQVDSFSKGAPPESFDDFTVFQLRVGTNG